MPTPSKFRRPARTRALAVLQAGGSRRQAAFAAGVHRSQITRWIQRGDKRPGGSYASFADAVRAAEASAPTVLAMPDIDDDPTPAELRIAWRVAQRELDAAAREVASETAFPTAPIVLTFSEADAASMTQGEPHDAH
jgi:hypothetical protein